jgi:RNA polymerase sigma factor (TIGR02999 family)
MGSDDAQMSQVTLLLDASRRGDSGAVEQLFGLLYQDLRQLAHAKLRRSGQFTLLDTTGLVHESYLRLFKAGSIEAQDRGHFMGYAAQVMRSIVVDFVRRRSADRRGGDAVHVDLDAAAAQVEDPREREVLQIHEALQELSKIDPRLVRVVEMRYFAGMTEVEVADALDRSVRSVARDWEKARLFLATTLTQ